MGDKRIEALTFDTGGTILDWHTGFSRALAQIGRAHGVERDWAALANQLRKRSLARMIDLGQHEPPAYNFDGAHRTVLDEILQENGLAEASDDERRTVWWDAVHTLRCWPDFAPVLPRLRERYICASFTILSYRIIIDTARCNGLSWDAVISCEGIGKYKTLPQAYETAARYLQLEPAQICMVACHNFDLDAAKRVGFQTAFVHRPQEWGPAGPPDAQPNAGHDIIAQDFPDLLRQLS